MLYQRSMMQNPFDSAFFIGYVNEVSAQGVHIHFPSANLLHDFRHYGSRFPGGNVGSYVVIEGAEYGFLAKIVSLSLPDSERKEITEKAILHNDAVFHPIAQAELLLTFSVHAPNITEKTVARFPSIGAKAYSCSDEQMATYIKEFGKQTDESKNIYTKLGVLTSNHADCNVSLNSLFNRHCAIVGTTGGGKSWTVAKLIELIRQETDNKITLIDATGEYANQPAKHLTLGSDAYFPYHKLTIADLFFLLRPTGQSQRPILLEAIRSLKIVRIINDKLQAPDSEPINNLIDNGVLKKAGKTKVNFKRFYYRNIKLIEDNSCNFNIHKLPQQIREECVFPVGGTDDSWGNFNARDFDYQTSLICRIGEILRNDIFSELFGFSDRLVGESVISSLEEFLTNRSDGMCRISFEQIPSVSYAKEIVANAIAAFLLITARKKKFRSSPVVLILDEAHQFLNKNVNDDYFSTQPLEAFDIIAKECRKYGLFLGIATQMPRDIPIGTLSQMGTFIAHRLINEQDRKAIENACSSANRNSLAFLPALGAGEALLIGVDFPMPLTLKIEKPLVPPNSQTPSLTSRIF